MKISKHRIKQLILESFRKVLKESDEEDSNKNQNEIYTKLSPLINSDKEDDFNSGLTLLEQLVTMESHKSKTEEAIKELAEDLFKKIKEIPLSPGNINLKNEVEKLYSDLARIEATQGQYGDEYYFALAAYNDAEAALHDSDLEPSPQAINLHQRLEKVLKLIGLNSPSFIDIYGEDSGIQTQEDDPLLDDIDYEEFDYDDLDFSYDDSKYDGSSDDDDWLY